MSMKKRFYFNIFVSVTALMGAMVFTSCGQDDVYSETNAERIANDKYAAAFEKAFGKVGSDVDWGFSSKNSSTRAFTRSGVAFSTDITFPEDCDDSNFTLAHWCPSEGVYCKLTMQLNGSIPTLVLGILMKPTNGSYVWWRRSKLYVTGTLIYPKEIANYVTVLD